MLESARTSVSWTRSSARSKLPVMEIAKARNEGTAASMASRSSGSTVKFFPLRGVWVKIAQDLEKAIGNRLAPEVVVHGAKLRADMILDAAVQTRLLSRHRLPRRGRRSRNRPVETVLSHIPPPFSNIRQREHRVRVPDGLKFYTSRTRQVARFVSASNGSRPRSTGLALGRLASRPRGVRCSSTGPALRNWAWADSTCAWAVWSACCALSNWARIVKPRSRSVCCRSNVFRAWVSCPCAAERLAWADRKAFC